jgi:hypothetical protein
VEPSQLAVGAGVMPSDGYKPGRCNRTARVKPELPLHHCSQPPHHLPAVSTHIHTCAMPSAARIYSLTATSVESLPAQATAVPPPPPKRGGAYTHGTHPLGAGIPPETPMGARIHASQAPEAEATGKNKNQNGRNTPIPAPQENRQKVRTHGQISANPGATYATEHNARSGSRRHR